MFTVFKEIILKPHYNRNEKKMSKTINSNNF